MVMPKKRNASKHGKCNVGPASNPAAPTSAVDSPPNSCDAPPVGLTLGQPVEESATSSWYSSSTFTDQTSWSAPKMFSTLSIAVYIE